MDFRIADTFTDSLDRRDLGLLIEQRFVGGPSR